MNLPGNRPTPIFTGIGLAFGVAAWIVFLGPESKFSVWEVLANTLLLVSFSILTVVILQFLWAAFGGDPLRRSVEELRDSSALLADSNRTGIRRVLTRSGTFGGDQEWLDFLLAARRNGVVDIMGYTLNSWLGEGFDECITELVNRGVKIRALLMDPENSLFGLRFNENIVQQQPADLAQDCSATINAFERIKLKTVGSPGGFQYRVLKVGSIKMSYTRVDSHALAVPYLYSVSASSAPLLRVAESDNNDGLFRSFTREFSELWDKAKSE